MTADTAEASIITSTNTMVIGCGCVGSPVGIDSLDDDVRRVTLGFFVAGASRSIDSNHRQFFDGVKGFGYVSTSLGTNLLNFRFINNVVLPDGKTPPTFMQLFLAGATWNAGTQAAAGSTGASVSAPPPWGFAPGFAIAHQRADVSFTTTTTKTGTASSNTHTNTNTHTHTNTVGSTFPNPVDPAYHYALFSFTDSYGTYYGWIDLAIEFNGHGPTITVNSWAYDDTGRMLGAGETPEPSTFALTGIAALALGARGIRRWRAARTQS